MPYVFSIPETVLRSIFIGFGIVIPILVLSKTYGEKKVKLKQIFIHTSLQAVRVAGVVYFILYLLQSLLLYNQQSPTIAEARKQAFMFGEDWLYYWYPPLIILLLTQVWWVKKIALKKTALVTFGLMLLILPVLTSERVAVLLSGFYRDYVPADEWSFPILTLLAELAINTIVFIFIIFTIMNIGGKFKTLKE